nr:DNA polymerase III subunit gamma/tau [Candidatus Woesebacteria bacterium]
MSWNRIYRPKQIAQLHNTAVREYFLSLLTAGALPQVFLFTGPKGIGKTSTARILAALVNDPANQAAIQKIFFTKEKNTLPLKEPSLENDLTRRIFEGSSFVVTELDAASNRGIDDIRALKERISLPPQEGSMAVYILDEVHMLTTEAFNALLKILEEPPAHVIFILATTELEKIPPTIISRAQIIRFTQATDTEILAALSAIVTAEKLEAEPEALEVIVNQSEGSFRDAVKLLEMVAQVGPITQKATTELLFGAIKQTAPVLVTKLLEKDQEGIVVLFQTLSAQQANPKLLHTQL